LKPALLLLAALAFVLASAPAVPARADDRAPSGLGVDALRGVGFDQRIGERVPLDARFRDEHGNDVALGAAFGRRPVVMALVYNECPMLCSLVLSGLVGSLRALTPSVGDAFDVLVVSFDPKDTPETARKKKERTLHRYGRPGTEAGFHFFTGDAGAIAAVTKAVGFRYELDPSTGQYAHPAGIVVLMPDGTIARYLYGSEFSPRDLQLATAEASQGKTSVTNQLLMLCYRYDPQRGTYSWAVLGALRLGGGLTVAFLGAFVVISIRRDRRRAKEAPK
jgi:protein SCO1/2